jgi:hypothetical protein
MSQENLQVLLSRLETDDDQIALIHQVQTEMSNLLSRFASDFDQKIKCCQENTFLDGVREFRGVFEFAFNT